MDENFFENIDTKEKAYWLGFLYADGYVSQSNNRLTLDLSKKDYQQLEKFCNAVGANVEKIKERLHSCGSESVSIRINSKEFVKYIIDNGCVNAKSKIISLISHQQLNPFQYLQSTWQYILNNQKKFYEEFLKITDTIIIRIFDIDLFKKI